MRKHLFAFSVLIFLAKSLVAQVLTNEDSLQAGLYTKDRATVISGYGEVQLSYDLRLETAKASVTRAVVFLGHRFNPSIAFFSEMELEDAQVGGEHEGGEFSLEQLYLKFNLNRDHYITAGLFLPRIGIINENHLPNTFNGNSRPFTEQLLIPATWREIGIGLYGKIPFVPGLNYSVAVLNGLSSADFTNGTGIRNGRFSGKNATMSNLAVTGSLLYYTGDFRFQVSGYYGGTAGLTDRDADSLLLDNSMFGTPVGLTEGNIQYNGKVFSATALAAYIAIPAAEKINRAYANNTPSSMTGGYLEAAIDILKWINPETKKSFTYFARYEMINLNQDIPANGIINDINDQSYLVTGVSYKPAKGVVIKADYVLRNTGEPNPQLILNPFPQAQPYYTSNGFINLGVGYSF